MLRPSHQHQDDASLRPATRAILRDTPDGIVRYRYAEGRSGHCPVHSERYMYLHTLCLLQKPIQKFRDKELLSNVRPTIGCDPRRPIADQTQVPPTYDALSWLFSRKAFKHYVVLQFPSTGSLANCCAPSGPLLSCRYRIFQPHLKLDRNADSTCC